jgi:hypothetical protein
MARKFAQPISAAILAQQTSKIQSSSSFWIVFEFPLNTVAVSK